MILFDEIGRGTATFDGMAIAQAMIEYIASEIHCMTLFSTHYHELTFLEDKGLGIQNVHASARVDNDHLVFEYLIKKDVLINLMGSMWLNLLNYRMK